MDCQSNAGRSTTEASTVNIEDLITQELCKIVAEALDVSYPERRNFEALLSSSIKDKLFRKGLRGNSDGLLLQYLHHELRTILNAFKYRLSIDDNSLDINEDHATHSKFHDLIKVIEKKKYIVDMRDHPARTG